MKQEEFYSIGFNSNNVELFVEVIGEYDDQKLGKGEYNPNPLKVKKSQGRIVYDIVRLQDVYNFLISPRLIKNLTDTNLSGWKVYNVETDTDLDGYKGFQCTGKSGIPNRPKEIGFITGYDFDSQTWDGSDFFIPDTTMMLLCTEKAKKVLDNFNLKNIKLSNLRKLKWYNS